MTFAPAPRALLRPRLAASSLQSKSILMHLKTTGKIWSFFYDQGLTRHVQLSIYIPFAFYGDTRRGDRVADRASLERKCCGNATEGSNPSLSASPKYQALRFFFMRVGYIIITSHWKTVISVISACIRISPYYWGEINLSDSTKSSLYP